MKTKNFVLASAAFVFAIGGAIASTMVATPVFVKARLEQNGQIRCVNTGVTCESTGAAACTVQVPTTSTTPPNTTASSAGTFKTYNASDCENILRNTTSTTIVSGISTYELVP